MQISTNLCKKLIIFIFSFNRGRYLQNCVNSIEKCANDFKAVIIDDNSTDAITRKILESLNNRHKIIYPRSGSEQEFKTGGLYKNMNYAMNYAREKNFNYALFIQDDQQLVRKITEQDILSIETYFSENVNSFQLYTCFLKKYYQNLDKKRMSLDKTKNAYFREDIGKGGLANFSAVGVFMVNRFLELYDSFEIGEQSNDRKVGKRKLKMGFFAYPFMMWLPFPKSYRGKKRNRYHKFIEWYGKAGVYPINLMSALEMERLFNRKLEQLPVAESFLTSPDSPYFRFWSTTGGHSNIIALAGYRSYVGRFLSKFLKLLKLQT